MPRIEGPRNPSIYNISVSEGKVLWISTANRDNIMDSRLLRFGDGIWAEYFTDFGLNRSIVDAVPDPSSGVVWLAHWGKGLYVLQDDLTPDTANDRVVLADSAKTIFKPTIGKSYYVCSDIATDHHGYVWVINHQVSEKTSGAVVLDGWPITKHQTYSPEADGLATAEITGIDIDTSGWIWLTTSSYGLMGVRVGDDPFDKSDTVVQNLNLDNGLLSMNVTAVHHDLDGDVWVGTKGGLNRVKLLSGNRLKVEDVNAYVGGQTMEISAIEVDDDNNKWIGTSTNGIYRLDKNNDLTAHFRTDNSGIFSNTVFSVRYDPAEDVVWVGTDTGLNKFFLTGSGEVTLDKSIHVFPNPFEIWGTNSYATFTNLKAQSKLKIYSFNGEAVNELLAQQNTTANVATVIWNGSNYRGSAVASGVYFFAGTDAAGKPFKDKMVVIRR